MSTDSAPQPLGDKATARSAYVLDDEPEIGTLVATVLGACGYAARKFTAPAPFFRSTNCSPCSARWRARQHRRPS